MNTKISRFIDDQQILVFKNNRVIHIRRRLRKFFGLILYDIMQREYLFRNRLFAVEYDFSISNDLPPPLFIAIGETGRQKIDFFFEVIQVCVSFFNQYNMTGIHLFFSLFRQFFSS